MKLDLNCAVCGMVMRYESFRARWACLLGHTSIQLVVAPPEPLENA